MITGGIIMIRKIGSLAGMLGTLLFTLSFTVNGALRPGYDPVKMYISELSIGPQGWIQIISFMFFGVCIFLFALGLKASLNDGKASKSAPILFMIIAVFYFLSGPFVTDPMSMFDNQLTFQGTLHGVFGAIVFSLSAINPFILWRRFRIDDEWKSLSIYTLTTGIVIVILIVLMKIKFSLTSKWNLVRELPGQCKMQAAEYQKAICLMPSRTI